MKHRNPPLLFHNEKKSSLKVCKKGWYYPSTCINECRRFICVLCGKVRPYINLKPSCSATCIQVLKSVIGCQKVDGCSKSLVTMCFTISCEEIPSCQCDFWVIAYGHMAQIKGGPYLSYVLTVSWYAYMFKVYYYLRQVCFVVYTNTFD